MAEIQKPSDKNQPDDSKAGKPDSLNPDRSVSGADVGKAEKRRVNKFTTFGKMTTIKDGDSLEDASIRQSALDNPLTIDYGDGASETSAGKQYSKDQVIAGNPFADGLSAAKKEAEKLWHPDREHPDIRMNYMADLEAFQATGLAKYGIDPLLIAATIRNEIVHRDQADAAQDQISRNSSALAHVFNRDHNWSVGDTQMKQTHMKRLVEAVKTDGTPTFPHLQALKGRDWATFVPSREQGAALVGAYFSDVAARLERKEDPLPWYKLAHEHEIKERISSLWSSGEPKKRTEALIRSFNAGDGAKHVTNIHEQLRQIRQGPARLFE